MTKTIRNAILAVGAWAAVGAFAQPVDRVAAVVNNDIIPMSEVEQRAGAELMRLKSREADPAARTKMHDQVVKQALDQLIAEKLLEAEAKDAHLEPTDQQVDLALDDVKKENNLSDEQFRMEVGRQGYSWDTYRQFMRRELARMELFRAKLEPKVKVSEQDARAEYQRLQQDAQDSEIHVRHIVVAVSANATPTQVSDAKKKADDIAAEARKPGTDFAELAKKRSQGSSANDGGDLGFFQRGTMEKEFEAAAFSLKKGQVSDPVRTQFGWHVIKLEERRAASMKPFDDMKQEIVSRLRQSELGKLAAQYVQQLRENASVEVKI